MDFAVAEPVQRAIESIVSLGSYGYPWQADPHTLAEAFARYATARFGWQVAAERVRPITDVVQGIAACLLAFTEPGDGVVIQSPAYPPFFGAVAACGRRVLENPLRDDGERFVLDLDGLEALIDERTRILLLCNPHNPTGRVFARSELAALAELAVRHDLVVVCDEIHADLVYPGFTHVPFAALSEEASARTVVLTSATKGFNLAGLRCAVAYLGGKELARRFDHAVPGALLGQITHISKDATLAAWNEGQPWLEAVLARLAANRELVAARLARDLPLLGCHRPESTYLAWIDCSALALGTRSPVEFFLDEARVALKGGTDFGEPGRAFVRLNFAAPPELLETMLDEMAHAVERSVAGAAPGPPVSA
jgi:cystathionine beta-lyase